MSRRTSQESKQKENLVVSTSTSSSMDDGSLDGKSATDSQMDLVETTSIGTDNLNDYTHQSQQSGSYTLAHRRTAKARAGRNKKKDRVLWSATRKRAPDGSFMKSDPSEWDAIRRQIEENRAVGGKLQIRGQDASNPADGSAPSESDGDSVSSRKRGRPRKRAQYTTSSDSLDYYEGTGVGKRRVAKRVDPDFSYASMEYGRRAYREGVTPHGAYKPPLPSRAMGTGVGADAMSRHLDQLNNLVNEAKDNHDDQFSDSDAANTILQFQRASGVDSQALHLQEEIPVEKKGRGRPRKPEGYKPGYTTLPGNRYSGYGSDGNMSIGSYSSADNEGRRVDDTVNRATKGVSGVPINANGVAMTKTEIMSKQARDVLARSKDILNDKNIIVDKHGRLRERGSRGQFVKSDVSNFSINLHSGVMSLNKQGKQRHGVTFNYDEDKLYEQLKAIGVDAAMLPQVVTLEQRIKQDGMAAVEAERVKEIANRIWSPEVLMNSSSAPELASVENQSNSKSKSRNKKKKAPSKSTSNTDNGGTDDTIHVDLFFSKAFDIIESQLLTVLRSLARKQAERVEKMTDPKLKAAAVFPHLPGISTLVSSLITNSTQDKNELSEVVRMKSFLDGIFFYYSGNISDLLTEKYFLHKGNGAEAFASLQTELESDKKALMKYIVVWSKEEQMQVQEMYAAYLGNQEVIRGVERGDLGILLTQIGGIVRSKSREEILEYIIRFIQGAEALDNVLADEAVQMKMKSDEESAKNSLRKQVVMVESESSKSPPKKRRGDTPLSPGAAKTEAANILYELSAKGQPKLAVEVDTNENGGNIEMVIKDTTLSAERQEIYRGDVHLTQQDPSEKEAVLETLLTDYLSFYYQLAFQELDSLTFLMLCNSLSLMFQRIISTTELALRVRVILGYNTFSSHNRQSTLAAVTTGGDGFLPVAMPQYTNSTLLRKSSTVRQALLDLERQGKSVGGESTKLVQVFNRPSLASRTTSNDSNNSDLTDKEDVGEIVNDRDFRGANDQKDTPNQVSIVDENTIPLPQKSIGLTEYYHTPRPLVEGTQQHLTTYSNFLHHLCSPRVADVILRHSNVVPVLKDTESWALLSRLWREIPECSVKGMWITRGKAGAEKPLYQSNVVKSGQ